MDKFKNKLIVVVAICLMYNNAWSQKEKLKVLPEDYKKWSTLSGEAISPDGLWTTYMLRYENKIDTIFVQNNKTLKKYFFANATKVEFSPDSKSVVIQMKDNTFSIQDLKKESRLKINDVARFEFSEVGNYVVVLQNLGSKNKLLMYNDKNKIIHSIPNTYDFKISTDGKLAVYTNLGISIYTNQKKREERLILQDTIHKIKKMVWSKSGNVLTFLQEEKPIQNNPLNHKIYSYNGSTKKLSFLDNKNEKLKTFSISAAMQTPIILSTDGSQVFFYYTATVVKEPQNDIVEVWDGETKLVYPAQKLFGDSSSTPKIAVWYSDSGLVNLLATDEFPMSILTSDKKYVLNYSHLTNEPQYEMVSVVDYHLTEVKTGKTKLLLSKQTTAPYTIGSSPSGRYINYFRDGNWWIYDITEEIHTNITSNLDVSFDNVDFDEAGRSNGYKCPGWSADNKYIILYDKYDIWLISPEGKVQKRITNGRESKITYRICDYLYLSEKTQGSADFVKRNFDLSKGIVLTANGQDKATGYFLWTDKNNLKEMVYGNVRFSRLKKANKADKFIFIEEDFQTPPLLNYIDNGRAKPTKLFQTNAHFKNYQWGTSKLISC